MHSSRMRMRTDHSLWLRFLLDPRNQLTYLYVASGLGRREGRAPILQVVSLARRVPSRVSANHGLLIIPPPAEIGRRHLRASEMM